ncbi:MAG: glycosyltransferase family 4 protein [Halothece sp.]
MKILLVSNYLFDNQQSMQRFAQMLETGLTQFGHEVRLLRPKPVLGRLKPSSQGLGKWLGYLDKFILFPPALKKAIAWADIVHICDHSNAFYTKYLQNVPHLVTCNDLLAIRSALGEIEENQTKWTGRQLQRMVLNGLNKAERVACISEQTRQELLRLSDLHPQDVSRIYMGLNYPYKPMDETEAKKRLTALSVPLNVPFILHVGANHWYKNRIGVLKIFHSVLEKHSDENLYLVMAGSPFTGTMRNYIKNHNLTNKVIELIGVPNEDLQALYSTAKALLFPSLQEGFGWPIIEAQACGCPVFTSNRPPMTEVGGDAAIYIDPELPKDAANQIIDSFPKLDSLKEVSLANAEKFKLETMISKYLNEYDKVITHQTFIM